MVPVPHTTYTTHTHTQHYLHHTHTHTHTQHYLHHTYTRHYSHTTLLTPHTQHYLHHTQHYLHHTHTHTHTHTTYTTHTQLIQYIPCPPPHNALTVFLPDLIILVTSICFPDVIRGAQGSQIKKLQFLSTKIIILKAIAYTMKVSN